MVIPSVIELPQPKYWKSGSYNKNAINYPAYDAHIDNLCIFSDVPVQGIYKAETKDKCKRDDQTTKIMLTKKPQFILYCTQGTKLFCSRLLILYGGSVFFKSVELCIHEEFLHNCDCWILIILTLTNLVWIAQTFQFRKAINICNVSGRFS